MCVGLRFVCKVGGALRQDDWQLRIWQPIWMSKITCDPHNLWVTPLLLPNTPHSQAGKAPEVVRSGRRIAGIYLHGSNQTNQIIHELIPAGRLIGSKINKVLKETLRLHQTKTRCVKPASNTDGSTLYKLLIPLYL